MLVLKIHMIFLFHRLVDLIKLVHVQLPNKRRKMTMPKKMRQHLILQFLSVFYQDLPIFRPTQVVTVLLRLENVVKLNNKLRNTVLVLVELSDVIEIGRAHV